MSNFSWALIRAVRLIVGVSALVFLNSAVAQTAKTLNQIKAGQYGICLSICTEEAGGTFEKCHSPDSCGIFIPNSNDLTDSDRIAYNSYYPFCMEKCVKEDGASFKNCQHSYPCSNLYFPFISVSPDVLYVSCMGLCASDTGDSEESFNKCHPTCTSLFEEAHNAQNAD